MNDFFNQRSLIRIGVSLFAANLAVGILGLTGPIQLVVFIGVYLGVSKIFAKSADSLLDEEEAQKEQDQANPFGTPPVHVAQVVEGVDQRISESLAQIITRLEPNDINQNSTFEPIMMDESGYPRFDEKSNKIHITKSLFEDWLQELESRFQILIPESKLNEWALNTPIHKIELWLLEQPKIN